MNEQEQISQLSALFDGELPPEQAGMVIRRALRDPGMRATWGRYALIGACVRGDPIGSALPQSDVAARVRARLAAEAGTQQRRRDCRCRRRKQCGTPPLAAGARGAGRGHRSQCGCSVAGHGTHARSHRIAHWCAARHGCGSAPRNETLVAAVEPAQRTPVQTAVREASLPSYTTPVDDSPSRRNAPLVSYVVAHNQVAASAVGFAPLSSVMSGSYDLTQDAVEMTAAEVGARR